MPNGDDAVPKIFRNEMFYFIARACMIVATLIGLPVASFLMSRVVASADEISAAVRVQAVKIELLSQRVDWQLRIDSDRLGDHENRIRQIERK